MLIAGSRIAPLFACFRRVTATGHKAQRAVAFRLLHGVDNRDTPWAVADFDAAQFFARF